MDEGRLDYWSGKDYQMIYQNLAILRDLGCDVDHDHLLPQIDAYLLRQDVWPEVRNLAASLLKATELHELQPADYGLPAFTPFVS